MSQRLWGAHEPTTWRASVRLDVMDALRRLAESNSAVLGTVDRDRGVHLVPVVFTVVGVDRIFIAVDSKPKRSRQLRRLANIEADPRVTLLVDEYDDDWHRLWWIRVDGLAAVHETIESTVERSHRMRYPQLEEHELGPWIVIEIQSISSWSAGRSEPNDVESQLGTE